MNQTTSPAATGTAGVSIAALVAAISWLSNRFGLNLSAQDQVSIAGGIVVAAHWLAQQYAVCEAARVAASVPAVPVAPSIIQQ